MNLCSRCHELSDKGIWQGMNFVCGKCLQKEATIASQIDRRVTLPDGRIKYPCGHIMVIPKEGEANE